jgi:purine-nucleoside/S-methyl-5'-thioadenosine phosphorylase / adenosine deaminase
VRKADPAERPRPAAAVPRAELEEWRERFGLLAGITERGGGTPPFSLALKSPEENAETILERLRALRADVRPAFTAFQMAHQVHGTRVAWHDAVAPGFHLLDDTDGHATRQPGLLLAVSVADCVPIYLAANDGSAIALLHAGWRGVAAGMLEAGLAALRERAGVTAGDVVIHCGVAICGGCYEVGPEVIRAVEGRAAAGPEHLDLRAALARRARAAGVREVTVSPFCTSCDGARFFSHRASRGDGGRQLAYLGRPLPG